MLRILEAISSRHVRRTFTLTLEPPILGYPILDHTLGFILYVHALAKGLDAVLLQYQENELRVIGYE